MTHIESKIRNHENILHGRVRTPRHEQIRLTHFSDVDIDVDVGIFRLITELWAMGIVTYSSCQGDVVEPIIAQNGLYIKNREKVERARAFITMEYNDHSLEFSYMVLAVLGSTYEAAISTRVRGAWGHTIQVSFDPDGIDELLEEFLG